MGRSKCQDELATTLQANELRGWQKLVDMGFVAEFQKISNEEKWPAWGSSSDGFLSFCIGHCPSGHKLLYALIEVLTQDGKGPKASAVLPDDVLAILRAVCTVGIERWVKEVMGKLSQIPLSPTPPDLSKKFRIHADDEWAVYLMAVCQWGLKMNFPSLPSPTPPGLLKVLAPTEHGTKETAVHDALMACNTASSVVRPTKTHVQGMMRTIRKKLGSAPVFGLNFDDWANPLKDDATRAYAHEKFDVPTVEYGCATTDDASLKEFENDLRAMIDTLHDRLNPSPHPGDKTMSSAPQPSGGNTVTNHFHAPVGVVGSEAQVAQAIGSQSQATIGSIHNHASNTAAFEALLNAFITEMKATPALAGKQAILVDRLDGLKQLATSPDQGPEARKMVKGYIDDVKMAIEGFDVGSELVNKANAVIAWCTLYWSGAVGLMSGSN